MSSEMFRNYPQPDDYVPNNRPKCHKPFKLDIMTGETAIHTFEIPFDVKEVCDVVEVIYKSGLTPEIVKNDSELEIITDDWGHSIITCTLSAEETSLFTNTLLDTKVQLKFYMKNQDVTYSDIYNVKVVNSLDN